MIVHLLDVNLLLALLDPQHISHDGAHEWFDTSRSSGWASCPMTQNGYIRIASQTRYSNPVRIDVAVGLLADMTSMPTHRFWPDDITILDPAFCDASILGSARNVADVYLLALAAKNGGSLATLDRGLNHRAVPNGADHLNVIA